MGSSKKRKQMEERVGEDNDEVPPKRREVEEKEAPADGCSHQLKEDPLTRKPSFLMGLQTSWSRIAGFLRNTRENIMEKSATFWTIVAQLEKNKKRRASRESSNDAGERSALERSRKRTRTEHQGGRAALLLGTFIRGKLSMRKSPEGQRRMKAKRKLFGTYSSSGVLTDEEQAEPIKKFRAETAAPGRAGQETPQKGADSPTSTVPLTIERFTFHHVLGDGAYGTVMLATDSIRRERVAVKIIKKGVRLGSRLLLVEGRTLRVSHGSRFLVHGYGAFHTKSYAYYVMELVSGGTLQDLVQKSVRLNYPTTRFIAAEMVCGIEFLHSKGIIHRDLKPNNVLLTRDGHVKITDFGLSLDNVFGKARNTRFVGTHGYAAPEMILGEPYSTGLDWFAFGVIVHIMVRGIGPFHAYSEMQKDRLVLGHEPTYEGLDYTTADLLSRLLCKDQSCRLGVVGNVQGHPFFFSVHWHKLKAGKVPSPIKMSKDPTDSWVRKQIPVPCSEEGKMPISGDEQEVFKYFPFVCSKWATTYHNVPMH